MPSIAHPTTFVTSARVSHRRAALLATIVAAAGAGAVTIAVVDDGGSGTGTQSLSRPAADVRFNGGPAEGTAVQSMRSEPMVRPSEGAAVQSMRPAVIASLARPDEGVAAQSLARSYYSARYDGGPDEGASGR